MNNETSGGKIRPGEVWADTAGRPIQAHGGGILQDGDMFYWFGENKGGKTSGGFLNRIDVIGMSCYSSADLVHWKNEGLALPAVKDDPKSDLAPSRVLERPKVIYNRKTGKYVMWMHADSADYKDARTGVAVADRPAGPYCYLGSVRPNGFESRDMTVFQDEDGKAYVFHSSENNKTMVISELSDDYLSFTGRYTRIFIGQSREAPAVFKYAGRYYVISSGCTGWAPNVAELAVADELMGEWKTLGNPCAGPGAEITFRAQSTFVLPVPGRDHLMIAMFDRWNPADLGDSRYVWLPVEIRSGEITIPWRDEWEIPAR